MTSKTDTVTVTHIVKGRHKGRFTLQFSRLPGRSFGPWEFSETVRDERNLVLDAHTTGSATTVMCTT